MLNILGKSINYGIKTGYNDAFIIDNETKEVLIKEDPKSIEMIKPILSGRDIQRYQAQWKNKYVILAKYGSHEYLEHQYSAICKHLTKYEERLKKRGQCRYGGKGNKGQHHWLELDNNPNCAYLAEFEKEKIAFPTINRKWSFPYVEKSMLVLAPMRFIASYDLDTIMFIQGILSSKLIKYVWKSFLGNMQDSTGYQMDNYVIEKIAIPQNLSNFQKKIIILIKKIIAAEGTNTDKLEKEIDQIVYQIYQLTEEEIKLVERF